MIIKPELEIKTKGMFCDRNCQFFAQDYCELFRKDGESRKLQVTKNTASTIRTADCIKAAKERKK